MLTDKKQFSVIVAEHTIRCIKREPATSHKKQHMKCMSFDNKMFWTTLLWETFLIYILISIDSGDILVVSFI